MQDYCQLAPNGHEILQADVRRLFHDDDSPADFEAQEVLSYTGAIALMPCSA